MEINIENNPVREIVVKRKLFLYEVTIKTKYDKDEKFYKLTKAGAGSVVEANFEQGARLIWMVGDFKYKLKL